MPFMPINVKDEIQKQCETDPEFKQLWEEKEKENLRSKKYETFNEMYDNDDFLSPERIAEIDFEVSLIGKEISK